MPTLVPQSPRESFNAAVSAGAAAVACTSEVEAPDGGTYHEVFLQDWATGEETRITHSDRTVNPHTIGTPGDVALAADDVLLAAPAEGSMADLPIL